MLAQQREFGFFLMIEQDLFPVAFGVARFALATEFSFMSLIVILLVARAAQLRRVFILLVDMAFIALHVIVLAQQLEVGLVVIELGRLPIFLTMAFRAIRPQLTFVCLVIILLMAGHTSLERIFIFAVDMAFIALHLFMLAQQFEIGLAVVEVGGFPIFLDVALGAVGAQSAFVLVVFLVTANTSGSGFTVFLAFNMATLALHLFVKVTAL